jgi:hypothetical protein
MEIKRTKTDIGKHLTVALKDLDGLQGKVGWFRGSTYETGEYVAAIAAQNEYGNPNKRIPARPFMRPTIREQQSKWLAFAAKLSGQVLEGKLFAHDAMESIASCAKNDILKKIESIYEPALAQRTINARLERYSHKGRLKHNQARSITKPLVDTGHMIATLTHTVEKS